MSHRAVSLRIGASVVLFHAIAGTAAGQIETRDWLLPESRRSDASRWSESNVPDTTMEIARLFPGDSRPANAPGDIPTATIDGFTRCTESPGTEVCTCRSRPARHSTRLEDSRLGRRHSLDRHREPGS